MEFYGFLFIVFWWGGASACFNAKWSNFRSTFWFYYFIREFVSHMIKQIEEKKKLDNGSEEPKA